MSLHADLAVRIAVDTAAMPWAASPSAGVWRKRLYLDGPPEAGRVTSIVRFDAGSQFARHSHPDGEEFFVLDGVFSDEHGDWPAGSYVFNPDGSTHAPYSEAGCTLFVRLRQHAGCHQATAVASSAMQLTALGRGCQGIALLTWQDGRTTLEQWQQGARELDHDGCTEYFVLAGELQVDAEVLPSGSWLRVPAGERLQLATSGCRLYIRAGRGY